MIERLVRYVLIVSSSAALIAIFYEILTERGTPDPRWLEFAIPAGLALNIAYLLFAGHGVGKSSRLMRLVSLWLDAKEAELRRRASRNSN
jgi:hypothetical protein